MNRKKQKEQLRLDFVECDTCRAKPGAPILCTSCLNNRRVIGQLKKQVKAARGEEMGKSIWKVDLAVEEDKLFDTVLVEADSILSAIEKAEERVGKLAPGARAIGAKLKKIRLIK